MALCVSLGGGPFLSLANTYTVTKSTDHDPAWVGEFRWAIEQANDNPGLDIIRFNIPNVSVPVLIDFSGNKNIDIWESVIIDGNTQPANGYTGIEPKIHFYGASYSIGFFGFKNGSNNSVIKNITFSNFANGGSGIAAVGLFGAQNIKIENNVFYNGRTAIHMSGNCDNNTIRANYFGTNRAMTNNEQIRHGVVLARLTSSTGPDDNPDDNLIGGLTIQDRNYFYNCKEPGKAPVLIASGYHNAVLNNLFKDNATTGINLVYDGTNQDKLPPSIDDATIYNQDITVNGTSVSGDRIEIYLSNSQGKDASRLIGVAITDNSGNWSFTVPKGDLDGTDYVIGTATDIADNTSEFTSAKIIQVSEVNSDSSCCNLSLELGTSADDKIVDVLYNNANQNTVLLGTNGSNIFVSCFNNSGDILWTKKIETTAAKPFSIVKTSNNTGYMVTAELFTNIAVFFISNSGVLGWTKLHGLSSNNTSTPEETKPYIVPTSGNKYFLLFNSKMENNSGSPNSRLGLGVIKMNSYGDVIWTKALRAHENFDVEYNHHISNGSGGVVSVASLNGNSSQIMEFDEQLEMTKFNFSSISPYFDQTGSYKVLKLQNGGYITLNSSFLSGSDRLLNIKKFDSQHNIIWNKKVQEPGVKWIIGDADLVEDNLGMVYIGVACKSITGSSNDHVKFIKINQNGVEEWIKKYPHSGENVRLDVGENCNSIIFSFTKNSGAFGGTDIILNKVDYDFNTCGLVADSDAQFFNESSLNQGFQGLDEANHVLQGATANSIGLSNVSLSKGQICSESFYCDLHAEFNHNGDDYCIGEPIYFNSTSYDNLGTINEYIWDFDDGSSNATSASVSHIFNEAGDFDVTLIVGNDDDCFDCYDTVVQVISVGQSCSLPCENCVGSFAPIPGEKYVVSAWAKEHTSLGYVDVNTYKKPYIEVEFLLSGGGAQVEGPFMTKGFIIDGWQLIEAEFEVPINTVGIQLRLKSQSGTVYFDDVRLFPFDGNMNSFVYDPNTLRLMAELDERNYSTFYEYDEEGRLVRIKKETERGVMTIKENRSFIKKNW